MFLPCRKGFLIVRDLMPQPSWENSMEAAGEIQRPVDRS